MRAQSIALVLALAALAACGGETPAPLPPPAPPANTAPPPPPPAEPVKAEPAPPPKATTLDLAKQTLPALVEALNQHDAKKFAGLYTEDASVIQPGLDPLKGRADVAQNAQKFFDAISGLKFATSRVWVKNDVVIQEWAMTGVHSGELKGIKATEKPVGVSGLSVLWVQADTGLIKEEHRYADMATILSQIGASKSKARSIPTLATSAEWHVAKGSPDEDKSLDLAKQMAAAIEAKKEADFVALHSDDHVFDDMTMPVPLKGKDEAKKWLKTFTTAFPDLKVTLSGSWAVEDYVISESVVTGTQKGPLPGVPASNKSVTLHSVDIGQVKDGKFARGWAYGNGTEFMSQISPPKAAPTPKPALGAPPTPAPKPIPAPAPAPKK